MQQPLTHEKLGEIQTFCWQEAISGVEREWCSFWRMFVLVHQQYSMVSLAKRVANNFWFWHDHITQWAIIEELTPIFQFQRYIHNSTIINNITRLKNKRLANYGFVWYLIYHSPLRFDTLAISVGNYVRYTHWQLALEITCDIPIFNMPIHGALDHCTPTWPIMHKL